MSAIAPRASGYGWPLTLSLGATTLGVLPPFLAGTLALTLRAEFDFGEAQLGALLMVYAATSALGSVPAGQIIERVGAGWGLRISLWGAALCLMATAFVATTWVHLLVIYLLGGLSQSGVHPASNMAVFRAVRSDRQGLAFGVKQAAIPAGTLIAGLAVPVAAQWLDWRLVFLLCAAAAGGLSLFTARVDDPAGTHGLRQRTRTRLPDRGVLIVLSVAAGLAVSSVQPQAAFFVSYAVESGMSGELAGTILAVAGLSSISMRILSGAAVDRSVSWNPLAVISLLMTAGAVGLALLGFGASPVALGSALLIGVGLGWSWNGLLPYAVARAHPKTPAAATAIPQVGLLAGAAMGPFVFGLVVERVSYEVAWFGASAVMVPAAILMWWGSRRLRPAAP